MMETQVLQKMQWSYVGLPKPLYERIRKIIQSGLTDFTSIRDYVRHCVRKDIRLQETQIAATELRWEQEHRREDQ